jgi:hypothetical protein
MCGCLHKLAVTETLPEKNGQKAKQKMPPMSTYNKENSIQESNFPTRADRTVLPMIKNLHRRAYSREQL